jgi:hypothetical protein
MNPVDRLLAKAEAKAAAKPAPVVVTSSSAGFTALEFIARHDALELRNKKDHGDYICYELTACPFNADHNGGSAAIFQYPDGRLGFKCHHASCVDNHWQELRELLEPGHKDRRAKSNGGAKATPAPAQAEPEPEIAIDPADLPKMVADIEQIMRRFLVLADAVYLPAAIWVIGTHAAQCFDCFPYIALLSPVKQCGKTRFLEVLETVTHRPWRGTAPSPAALYRMMGKAPTLLFG